MNLSVSDVENYLEAVKCAVKAHRYRLDMNAKRPDNRKLFQTYLLTEERCREHHSGSERNGLLRRSSE